MSKFDSWFTSLIIVCTLGGSLPVWGFATSIAPDSLRQTFEAEQDTTQSEKALTSNPDSLFQQARDLAFISKNNLEAIKTIKLALKLSPDNADFSIFLGRLYAWEGYYDSAAVQLQRVVEQYPDYEDARSALADVYVWSKQYKLAVQLLEEGLQLNPTNLEFRYTLALSLVKLNKNKRAKSLLREVLKQDPDHAAAAALLAAMPTPDPTRKLSVAYSLNRLADTNTQWQMLVGETTLDPWQLLTLEAEQQLQFGPIIGRVSLANRFDQTGTQFEMESYPALREGMYGYLGFGYSNALIFPKFRLGAELFKALPAAFEISLGFRFLHLATQDVSVFTASTGKYLGNYWLNGRIFITPQEVSASKAWNFQCRRYLKDEDTYVEMSLGLGESIGPGLGSEEISYLGSRHIAALGQWKLLEKSLIQAGLSLANVEVRKDSFRGDTGLYINYSFRF